MDGKKDDKKTNANTDTTDPVLASIFDKLRELTKETNERATATDTILQTLSGKFDKFSNGFTVVKEEVEHLKSEVITEKRENRRQDAKIEELEMKLEMIERDARRSSIVLEGVPEDKDQSLIDLLEDLLSDLQVNFGTGECDKIFRRGRRPVAKDNVVSTSRPIVIVFLRLSFKVAVFKGLRNLAGIARWNNIYLNDDFTPLQKSQANDLRSISALAKRKGYESRVRGNTLFVDGRRYSYRDVTVNRLPDGLSITAAKTIAVDGEKGVGFQSKHSVFSNMSECHLIYDGFSFNSAEEVYQYRKAKDCGTRENVQEVLVADTAQKAKSAGARVTETANWHRKKVQVMKEVLILKVESDCGLKEKLVESGKKDLYELTYDKFWGCGFPPSKSDQVKQKGNPGANKLGKLLMEIRNTLK